MNTTPFNQPGDLELLAHLNPPGPLVCRHSTSIGDRSWSVGREFLFSVGTYPWRKTETRITTATGRHSTKRYHIDGHDLCVIVRDDLGLTHRFMEHPSGKYDHDIATLWQIFHKPTVATVADNYLKFEQNIERLLGYQIAFQFRYYSGQANYIARLAMKDYALMAASVGTGKSAMALSLIHLKQPKRTLIIAPQGSVKTGHQSVHAAQWVQEVRRFAPNYKLFTLFSLHDFDNLMVEHAGVLPDGIYVTYPSAFFRNTSLEQAGHRWTNSMLRDAVARAVQCPDLPMPIGDEDEDPESGLADSLGEERNGIKCVVKPCMATMIGHLMDCVIYDEAHESRSDQSLITKQLIRLQPRYRYALTASPVHDTYENLFAIMGWLAVPGWHEGLKSNEAWPFARDELPRFLEMFRTTAHPVGEKKRAFRNNEAISNAPKMLKLLGCNMASITKAQCNPDYQPAEIVDVRVGMGRQQSALYAWALKIDNVPKRSLGHNARDQRGLQTSWLRSICGDPMEFSQRSHKRPQVLSNFNPKTQWVLAKTLELVEAGEQVVLVCARVGQTTTFQDYLIESGVAVSRIDSKVLAQDHSEQSALFKAKETQVMLMGAKCAVGYSFDLCMNEIVASIEWTPGSWDQIAGRIDRITNPIGKRIWRVLYRHSIEEVMFNSSQSKKQEVNLCLEGTRRSAEVSFESSAQFLPSEEDEAALEKAWLQRKALTV